MGIGHIVHLVDRHKSPITLGDLTAMQVTSDTIGTLYDKYGHIVYRRCRTILGNEEAALDATQDVFLKALKSLEAFRGASSPVTWLYRISTNLCLNRLRDQRNRLHKLQAVHSNQSNSPGSIRPPISRGLPTAAASEQQAIVRALLEKADESSRCIAVYYFYDGMTFQEIATVMHLSVPTIRKRLSQFKAQSKDALSGARAYSSAAQMMAVLILDSLLKLGL